MTTRTLLLVEDDLDVRDTLQDLLERRASTSSQPPTASRRLTS